MSREESFPAWNTIIMKKDSISKKADGLYRWLKYTRWDTKKRDMRHVWQRLTRGWPDSDLWSLDHALAKIILPRLKLFQQCRGGHPSDMTDQEWDDILTEMVFGIEWYASGDCWNSFDREKAERAQKGMELFGKYYGHLWT